MRIIIAFLLGLMIVGVTGSDALAQKKTLIFVRHAEKDVSETADNNDPILSVAGRERAERLVKTIGKFRPGAFYSTDFKRTRDTVTPLANRRNKQVRIYDAKDPQKLIDEIMRSRTKRFVISGHSNTIPGLVNLITKKELFKNLEDSEYGVIWIIRMRDRQVRRIEVLQY